jgi:hypothetical protein
MNYFELIKISKKNIQNYGVEEKKARNWDRDQDLFIKESIQKNLWKIWIKHNKIEKLWKKLNTYEY